ncbi:TetR/AcrR family transcriptional regulator [Propioniciclava coleopterorum]|uniref:TetR/AcrR family transcriptional regulator n=1 Tax=Propioniciclava coleopterorum TaxID=2714937 RepID=A0A6G7Y2T6_9ACTN|nr:TetR/AcrR family transcriptional regulator [Propioniciclava coleopterorum]QIK70958.1 TetR/AcrR family transcriptional regulator [Propioniciclava coleopterorum]
MFTERVQEVVVATIRDMQRRETVATVLHTAAELFEAKGFTETTIRDIATACGLSIGTVMSVGDKNGLLLATFDHQISEIHERRTDTPAHEGDAVDQIAALLDPLVDLFTSNPRLARSYASILIAGDNEPNAFTELSQTLIAEIEAVLDHGNRGGVSASARAVYFAYIGRLFSWSPSNDTDPDSLKQSIREVVEAICTRQETRP